MGTDGLTYTYDDLITKSEDIKLYGENFDKELLEFSNSLDKVRSTFSNEKASEIYDSLDIINEKSEDIQKSLINFALAIHDEIAPFYKDIEEKTKDVVTDIYG